LIGETTLSAPIPAFPQTGKGDWVSVGGAFWLGFEIAAVVSHYPGPNSPYPGLSPNGER